MLYKRLETNETKAYYREILDATTSETERYVRKFPEISMYENILSQLQDIKEKIVVEQIVLTEDEVFERCSLGAIAVKNFDLENEEYAQRLSDIFGGAMDYYKFD